MSRQAVSDDKTAAKISDRSVWYVAGLLISGWDVLACAGLVIKSYSDA